MMKLNHAPEMAQLMPAAGKYEGDHFINFLGVRTRLEYWKGIKELSWIDGPVTCASFCDPDFNEEYFEWLDIIQSVQLARKEFVMIEAGAGYGRWLVNAAMAVRRMNPMPFKLIAIEAEPTHFQWLKQHFEENGVNYAEHLLFENAVSDKSKKVKFHIGNPSGWYGQSIDQSQSDLNIFSRVKQKIVGQIYAQKNIRKFQLGGKKKE